VTGLRVLGCTRSAAVIAALVVASGCTSSGREVQPEELVHAQAGWDPGAAEVIEWQSSSPEFGQGRALEASGLTSTADHLYVVSEKYATLIQLDVAAGYRAEPIPLAVPEGSELEGVAFHRGALYICDEALAAVYKVVLDDEAALADRDAALPAAPLTLEGITVRGSKIGLEGVAVDPRGRLYLLLERTGSEAEGCESVIYQMDIEERSLRAVNQPFLIELEDCNWRLTALEFKSGRLLALKTRYPGEEYEVIAVDPVTGEWSIVLELTELARGPEKQGWGNNPEGLAVTDAGDLYMISDNAVTDVARTPLPPLGDERTLLLRLPAAR